MSNFCIVHWHHSDFLKDHFTLCYSPHLSPSSQVPAAHPGAGDPGQCQHRIPPWEAPHARVPPLVRVPPPGLCWAPAQGPPQALLTVWWAPVPVLPPLDTRSQGPLDTPRTTCTHCTKWGPWQQQRAHKTPHHSWGRRSHKFSIIYAHKTLCLHRSVWQSMELIWMNIYMNVEVNFHGGKTWKAVYLQGTFVVVYII